MIKERKVGEIFRIGLVLLKAVEDKGDKCQGCFFYHLCKSVYHTDYSKREEASDLLKKITGDCNGVKFIVHHDKIKTIVKRKKQKQWKENLRLVTK